MSKLRILIAAEEPFPIGMAATNRVLSLARGFVECGVPVHVELLRPLERPERGIVNRDARGSYAGISYEYAAGTTIRAGSFFARRMQMAKGMLRTAKVARESVRVGEQTALISYTGGLVMMIFLFGACRWLGITYIIDKSEFPFVLRNKSLPGKLYARLFTSYAYRLFDVVLVMTGPLEAYFRGRIRRGARMLHVPMTVEVSRFLEKPPGDRSMDKYVAYCGYLGDNKDGVPILIEAFAMVSRKYPELKLCIIGDSPGTDDLERLKQLAVNLNIHDRVVFTGRVHRDEIPRFLTNASVLALARPSSLQSLGGFPSKLGEYLSTGNPVVVTTVGDIPMYIRDGVNGFLAQPDNVQSFAAKLDSVLQNPESAAKVGKEGRRLAQSTFDYRVQAQRITDFLLEEHR